MPSNMPTSIIKLDDRARQIVIFEMHILAYRIRKGDVRKVYNMMKNMFNRDAAPVMKLGAEMALLCGTN